MGTGTPVLTPGDGDCPRRKPRRGRTVSGSTICRAPGAGGCGETSSASSPTSSRWCCSSRRRSRSWRTGFRNPVTWALQPAVAITLSSGGRGGWRIVSGATGSAPRAFVGGPRQALPRRPPGRRGQDCVRLRPWSAAYAANTCAGVPPVWRKRSSRMAARSSSAPASRSPVRRTSGRPAARPRWARSTA